MHFKETEAQVLSFRRKEKMKKIITQEKLEDMWGELNAWQTPKELKRKQNRLGESAKKAWFWGVFDTLCFLLTRKEQLKGWNRYLKSKELIGDPPDQKPKTKETKPAQVKGGSPERK